MQAVSLEGASKLQGVSWFSPSYYDTRRWRPRGAPTAAAVPVQTRLETINETSSGSPLGSAPPSPRMGGLAMMLGRHTVSLALPFSSTSGMPRTVLPSPYASPYSAVAGVLRLRKGDSTKLARFPLRVCCNRSWAWTKWEDSTEIPNFKLSRPRHCTWLRPDTGQPSKAGARLAKDKDPAHAAPRTFSQNLPHS